MAIERRKEIKRRRHRRAKLKKLKAKLAHSKDLKEREHLIAKIRRISLDLTMDLPEA